MTKDDIKETHGGGSHIRRTSSVRLSKDWLDRIVADDDDDDDDEPDYPDDEKGGLLPSSPKIKNKDKEVLVLLDKIAFFPLPTDGVPESPITTFNRRLSSIGDGDGGGLVEFPIPSTMTAATAAADMTGDNNGGEATTTTTTSGAAASVLAATPSTDDSKKEVISLSSSPKEEQNELLVERDDDSDDKSSVIVDDIGRSEHSELTAGGIWEDVPMAAPDDILGIAQNYRECQETNKVNVCVGAYRDEDGHPWVLPSVREAERRMMNDVKEDMEYLPIEGDRDYIDCAMRFAYGHEMNLNHLAAVQSLSGTGACRIGGAFLARFWPQHPIYIPDPTWGNHVSIFRECGLDVRRYRYYNKKTNGLDMPGMMKDLSRAPDGSIVLFHACAHNPTGCDPTIEDWKKIVAMVHRKEHVVFFDSAYQGFASGNAEKDAEPFRYAVSQHIPILLAQSFAKNFGLYGERVGTLSIVCGDVAQKQRILSELRIIIRPMYSSPPRHGSSIIKTILSDDALQAQYRLECAKMAERIQDMRAKLVVKLKEAGSVHDWSHITQQIGMFAFTGLNADMCQTLTQEYFIFLTTNGRISIAGLNDGNIEYVAQAIHAVSHGKPITTA